MKRILPLFLFILISVSFASCENSPYKAGDTDLSYIRFDMVDMHVAKGAINCIITDENDTLKVDQSFRLPESFAAKDTVYRMALYYNKVENKPVSIVRGVESFALKAVKPVNAITLKRDPFALSSVWKAHNNRYINLMIGLKGGQDTAKNHKIGIVTDSVTSMPGGLSRYYISIRHDQNSIPEYYTEDVFFSVSLDKYAAGDEIVLSATTYSGRESHAFKIDK